MNPKSMETPLVSIITVNYKQPRVTCELLDSIYELSYPQLETIVVDNGQHQDDSALYRYHLPDVKVINSPENLGFAGANNLGIKQAKGDYIFLLNNDTEVSDGLIEELLSAFDDPKTGAISPVLRYFDQPELIQFAGFTEINRFTGRNSTIKALGKESLMDTSYFHGAAVMIPKSVIKDSGLMPEEYFLYYEELDWSRMLREKGYSLKVCTQVSVLHKESVSTGKNSPLKTYYQNRNRIAFMNKQAGFGQRLAFNLFYHLVSLPLHLLNYGLRGKIKHLKALWRAFYHGTISKKMGMSF